MRDFHMLLVRLPVQYLYEYRTTNVRHLKNGSQKQKGGRKYLSTVVSW